MTKRSEAVTLVARQLALSHDQIWDRLPDKVRAQHRTRAESIVATVERLQLDYRWE
jgi:hypothetical protein